MGILTRKPKGLIVSGMFSLAVAVFISFLGFSFIDTIWAVYLNSFVKSDSLVGLISSFLVLISFVSFFLIVPFIEKYNKAKIFSYSLLFIGASYLIFALTRNFYLFFITAITVTVLHTARMTSFGIIIKDKSKKSQLSRSEGVIYTFMNLSWLIGPLIAGLLAGRFGVNIIFVLSTFFVLSSYFYFCLLKISDRKTRKRVDKKVSKVFIDFFKSKDRALAYFLGGGVNYWWSLIFLFMPLYIINNGLQIEHVGYFLFLSAIPLILFSYLFSNLAGKKGFKKIFKMGFFIPFLMSLLCFFTENVYVIMGLLILASLGLSMLEATTEAYFFDILKGKEDLRFYGPYNTTIDVNHFISRFGGGLVLLFFSFKYLFLFFSLSMLFFFILCFKAKNIIEKRRG